MMRIAVLLVLLAGCSQGYPPSSNQRLDAIASANKVTYVYPQIIQFQAPLCIIVCVPSISEIFTDAKSAQGFAGAATVTQSPNLSATGGSPSTTTNGN
jgi:hypothetical protein